MEDFKARKRWNNNNQQHLQRTENIYKEQEIEMGEVEIDERKRGIGRQIRRDSFKVKDSNTRKRILLCKRVYAQEGH